MATYPLQTTQQKSPKTSGANGFCGYEMKRRETRNKRKITKQTKKVLVLGVGFWLCFPLTHQAPKTQKLFVCFVIFRLFRVSLLLISQPQNPLAPAKLNFSIIDCH
jgi:hypothetical protein